MNNRSCAETALVMDWYVFFPPDLARVTNKTVCGITHKLFSEASHVLYSPPPLQMDSPQLRKERMTCFYDMHILVDKGSSFLNFNQVTQPWLLFNCFTQKVSENSNSQVFYCCTDLTGDIFIAFQCPWCGMNSVTVLRALMLFTH